MKKLAFTFLLGALFLLSIIAFIPKKRVYYAVEHSLKNEILLSNEQLDEGLFHLSIKNAVIYIKGIHTATLKKADIYPLILFNLIKVADLQTTQDLPLPEKIVISKLLALYSPLYPTKLLIQGESNFGTFKASYNPLKNSLILTIWSQKPLDALFGPVFTKVSDGVYRYAYNQ